MKSVKMFDKKDSADVRRYLRFMSSPFQIQAEENV
jgi:hypothetical protein